jgi:hypothetical protein
MFKNLLSREGLITTRSFHNPCHNIRSISEDESIFQSEQQINKCPQPEDLDLFIYASSFDEGAQEFWEGAEEEEHLEPEIAEFLACLRPEEEYQLGLTSLANQGFIQVWTDTVCPFHPFTFQQLLKSRSYEELVLYILTFVHKHCMDNHDLEVLIRRWLHWKYAYT